MLLLEKPAHIYVSNVQQEFQTQKSLRDNSKINVDALDRKISTSSFIVNLSVCRVSRSRLLFSVCMYVYIYIYIYI